MRPCTARCVAPNSTAGSREALTSVAKRAPVRCWTLLSCLSNQLSSPHRSGATSRTGARPGAEPAAPSPRQSGHPSPARTWLPGGGPAMLFEARAPSVRERTASGRCQLPFALARAHSSETGQRRPVPAMLCRPRRECCGTVGSPESINPVSTGKGDRDPSC